VAANSTGIHRTSLDYLARHAEDRPERVAIIDFGIPVTYRRFHADARRVCVAVKALGLGPGQIVLVSHPNSYVHWLLIIACEWLGAVSCSFHDAEPEEHLAPLFDLADAALSHNPPRARPGLAAHKLDNAWFNRVYAQPDPVLGKPDGYLPSGEDPVRITRSSGTTGIPKRILLRRRMLEYCADRVTVFDSLSESSAFFAGYNFLVNASFARVCACLHLGATVVFGAADTVLPSSTVTHGWMTPGDLATVLKVLPAEARRRDDLLIALSGAPVSPALWDAALARLCGRLVVGYGANEAGPSIAAVTRDGIGTPGENVGIRILDDHGNPAAEGAEGIIAMRSPGTVEGYIGDDDATRTSFQGGWFVSSDIGVALPGGRFRILGRRDEVLNLGGSKHAPGPMEDGLRTAIPGLLDLAITSVATPQGIEKLCIAIVLAPGGDLDSVTQSVRSAFGPSMGFVRVLPFECLPMTDTGKIRRAAIRAVFAAASDQRT
jgi:acyl-coenzyme A synthetase/AMP-(fatty) acid ligase